MQKLALFQKSLLSTTQRSTSMLAAVQQAARFASFNNYAVKARVQHPAPHFEGMSYNGAEGGFKKISLNDYKGKYVVLFTYPLDFTFVCPTEIIEFNDKAPKFRENSKISTIFYI